MEEEPKEEPSIDDIANNLEEYFTFPDSLSKYDPSKFSSEEELLIASGEIEEERYGIRFYYLSLILKFEKFEDVILSFEDKFAEEKKNSYLICDADWSIVPLYICIYLDLKENLRKLNIDIDDERTDKKYQCLMLKKYSKHYADYEKMKKLFGTEFRPRNSFL